MPLPIYMPRLVRRDKFMLRYDVPSKRLEHVRYALTILKGGAHNCQCPAKDWDHRNCRHYKLVTLKEPRLTNLQRALEVLGDRTKRTYVAWNFVGCAVPEHYNEHSISCPDCLMYPDLCNVHMVKWKRNAKPMVWRIQSAMIAGRRKEALRLLRLYVKLANAARKSPGGEIK